MDQKKMFKQMIEFNQTTFNNIFTATTLVQDQFEDMATAALDQLPGFPAEGRKSIENWAEIFKNGRNRFKQQMDHGFEQAEELFIG
jgi:hypothetical protein